MKTSVRVSRILWTFRQFDSNPTNGVSVLGGIVLALVFCVALPAVRESSASDKVEKRQTRELSNAQDGFSPSSDAPGNSNGASQETWSDVPADLPTNGLPDRTVLKLLPDFRIIQGSPTTVIDVSELFADAGFTAEGGPVEVAVIYNKKDKVVGAEVLDNRLLNLESGKLGKTEIIVEAKNGTKRVHTKFNVEVWSPDYWKLALTVIGGLGIFLLGMKNMSEGLQAVAGNSLRRLIGAVTNNRLMATGVGTLVTMLVQSSSITTVMVVGFVNSGFMTLAQAVGVIMGANIGTTITGWILVLSIGKYGLPIIGVAAFTYLFSKRDRIRYVAMAAMGLGMVFLGLELMKDGFAILKDLPEFEAWFEKFDAGTYTGVLKCAAVGCVLTFLVQSSSATLGITIGLAQIGVIPFETAAALVLGENVGTTITAWLASFGTTTNAKRAAYFHVVFNLLGVLWVTSIFQWYLMLIRYLTAGDVDVELSTTAAIATTHTVFNVANTILFLPFAGVLAGILTRIVPERAADVEEEEHLTNLDVRMLETPVIAVEQSRVELLKMADGCNKMMAWLREILSQDEPDEELMRKVLAQEDELDRIQSEIVDFMSNLLSANVPHTVINDIRHQLRMTDEYESVSDCVATILKAYRKLWRQNLRLPEHEHANVLELHDMVADYLAAISAAYRQWQHDVISNAKSRGDVITKHVKQLGHQTIDKTLHATVDERLDPRVSVAYFRQINAYRRVRDHVLNIAEVLAGVK